MYILPRSACSNIIQISACVLIIQRSPCFHVVIQIGLFPFIQDVLTDAECSDSPGPATNSGPEETNPQDSSSLGFTPNSVARSSGRGKSAPSLKSSPRGGEGGTQARSNGHDRSIPQEAEPVVEVILDTIYPEQTCRHVYVSVAWRCYLHNCLIVVLIEIFYINFLLGFVSYLSVFKIWQLSLSKYHY